MSGLGRTILSAFIRRLDSATSVAGSAVVVLTFGMLLWGRLLMTQDIPETALARPKRGAAAENATANPLRPTIHADLADSPDRDLFAIRTDLYSKDQH